MKQLQIIEIEKQSENGNIIAYLSGHDTVMAVNAAVGLTKSATSLNVYTFLGDTYSLNE